VDFIGLVMILTGAYLVWASVTNRKPGSVVGTIVTNPAKGIRANVDAAASITTVTNSDVFPTAVTAGGAGRPATANTAITSGGGCGAAAVAAAQTKLGKPYVWAAAGPNSFDCSGLVSWAYKQAGCDLGRVTTASILANPTDFPAVSKDAMQIGDLLFPYAGHMGMYIGNGQFIEARGEVRISPVKTIMAVRRVASTSKEVSL